MQQASRIVVIGLLALMQLFAPLVHAHAGRGDFPGAIHLPGLEFLARMDGTSAQPFTRKACLDVIVGLAPGFKDKGIHAVPSNSPELAFPPAFGSMAGLPSRWTGCAASRCGLPSRPSWLAPSPRAPPLLG